jgi:ribonucleoside-diphosphate reductase alpha chain
MLYQLRMPYASDQAVELAGQIMEFIDFTAKERSMELASDKGSFPNFVGSIYSNGSLDRDGIRCNWPDLIASIKKNGIRNATLTTIAPPEQSV